MCQNSLLGTLTIHDPAEISEHMTMCTTQTLRNCHTQSRRAHDAKGRLASSEQSSRYSLFHCRENTALLMQSGVMGSNSLPRSIKP